VILSPFPRLCFPADKKLIKFFCVPPDANLENNVSSTFNDEATEENPIVKPISVSKESRRDNEERLRSFRNLRNQYVESGSRRSEALEQNYETSYFYLM